MSARRSVLLVLSVVVVGSTIGVGVLSQRKESRESRESPPQKKKAHIIPPIYSAVKTLEIVSTEILDENTPFARVSVEIRNNSNKAVMAVDLVSGDAAVTKNGLTNEEKPIVVIEPYGTTTIEMGFGEMTPSAALVVSAAKYADGSEEGEQVSLEAMRAGRAHDKERLKAEREKAKGEPR